MPDINNANKKYQPPKEVRPEHILMMQAIGSKLIILREEKKISASKLCKDLGISRNSYHQMESGKVYFNILNLILVLDYHHISVLDFFKEV